MEIAEIKNDLEIINAKLSNFNQSLDLEVKSERLAELDEIMLDPTFWEDALQAQKIINESNTLKNLVNTYHEMQHDYEELLLLLELIKEEPDETVQQEGENLLIDLQQRIKNYELNMLLSGPYDKNNAILELHPGAGGTESQDWGEMLLRMYQRYADKQGYKVEVLDYQSGDEAGIKSVTLLIKGYNAYGYLQSEKGVHRLVRISPFDSAGRRHTSFVSCDVVPEFDDNDIEIEIKSEDLRIDTFRATGAGGQHINTTDSAVRITHIPTNIVVASQAERSQIKNRETAMKMLKAKLYQQQLDKQAEELAAIRGEQKEIGWGSQIRSYVFHPYSMVKDHRTSYETGNTQSVMDGNLSPFIDAYLHWLAKQ